MGIICCSWSMQGISRILSWSCPKGLKSVCGHKDSVQILHLNLPNTTKWNVHFKAQLTASINLALPKHALIGMFRRCHRKAYNIINESQKSACLSQGVEGLGLMIFWVAMDKYLIFVGFSSPPHTPQQALLDSGYWHCFLRLKMEATLPFPESSLTKP